MRYISYKTEHCIETALKYSLLNEIENLAKKVEKDQSIQAWDFFLPTPFIKKNLGKSYRLVCSQHYVENTDTIVIAFLSCFPRGGSGEYEKFIKNPEQVCGKLLPDIYSLKSFLRDRDSNNSGPEPPPKLNETERQYLYATVDQEINDDITIYESFDWVESLKNQDVADEITRFYDTLSDLLDSSEINSVDFYRDKRSHISIFYKYFSQRKNIFLISPIIKQDDSLIHSLRLKYSHLLELDICSDDIILKNSRKSYPSYVLADEKLWKSIQKDDVGNIALSPEETKILEEVTGGLNEKLFPLFINGRPGSGKSTILQYLFASHLCIYFGQEDNLRFKYPPLYLTYSENLLESAKKNVDDILKCNSNFAASDVKLLPRNGAPENIQCFGVFHSFLLDLLPSETKTKFPIHNKIDFPKFRGLWDTHRKGNPENEIRKLSSELAWHVLRSYIKGMRYDTESDFSVESYEELPNNQRTVEVETFKRVFNDVWFRWYKPFCEKNGYWDDQDLVFAVLNEPDLELSRYPAIFCDESQDFSKLELDLILRLSLYSKRMILPHELKRVPFAFAGDPFQTLNPTGFEWESLQANFHEKIVSGLDKSSNGKLEFNYHELSYNYRSGKFIVGLCNLFQLLRGILFDQKGIIPQHTWFDTQASMPVLFNVKDPVCEKSLRDQTELVIILPCQEGEEEEYVKRDEFLSSLTTSEIDIRNCISPMRAKGLEFSRVVLYKFGHECLSQHPNFFNPLSTGESHSEDMDTSLPLKYFINRLYVGASRAKFRLIIVDDDEGIETFWDNDLIKDFNNLLYMYNNSNKLGWDSNVINYVQKGVEDNWTQDRDDPLSLAKEFYISGITEKDPYKMRLAEANYYRCEQPSNAKLCKAERYKMEKQLSKAGDVYLEISRAEEALECYWSAGNFSVIANNRNFLNTAKQRAATYYIGNHSEAESEHFLQFLLEQLSITDSYKISWDNQWKKILNVCLESILKFQSDSNFERLYSLIREIEKKRLSPSNLLHYAELAFLAKDYEYAVGLWEKSPASHDNLFNYKVAKAFVSPYPLNVKWLKDIKNFEKIVQEWEKNITIGIDDQHISIIGKSLLEVSDFNNLVHFLKQYKPEDLMFEAYQQVKKSKMEFYQERIGKLLISKYSEIGKWKEIVELIDDKKISKSCLTIFSKIFVYEVAKSKDFPKTTNENKNLIAGLLKKLFIDSPWENIVSMRVVGAAIENAYKLIDALEFYEGVWKKNRIKVDKDDSNYATARWVKSKIRLAEFLENEGKRTGAGKHRAEAETICSTRLGINKEKIPENPEFDVNGFLFEDNANKTDRLTIPQKTKEGIIALHQTGWDSESIAESFNIELVIVKEIVAHWENDNR